MGKESNYECIRCCYETSQKNMMRRHLYLNKNICQALRDIDLTDTIKEYILANRKYDLPFINFGFESTPTPQQ
jgi:hypothetical protein